MQYFTKFFWTNIDFCVCTVYTNGLEFLLNVYLLVRPEIHLRIKFIYRRENLEQIILVCLFLETDGMLLTCCENLDCLYTQAFGGKKGKMFIRETMTHVSLFYIFIFGDTRGIGTNAKY